MSQKANKLPSGWRLLVTSLASYGRHFWRYVFLVGIVTIPINLLNLSSTVANDQVTGTYLAFASLFMNVALIWLIVRLDEKPSQMPGLRQAYYESSAAVVRFILAGLLLAAMLIPLAIGIALYALGANGTDYGVSIGEMLILGGVALILALPSFFLLVRFIFAVYEVVARPTWPIASLKASRQATLGRFWAVLGRLLLLILWLVLLTLLPTLVLVALYAVTKFSIFLALYQIIVSIFILPVGNIYLYRLYQELRKRANDGI